MARIRTVKPQHWNDKQLTQISLPAHLLWIGMWNFSDDEGIIEADPIFIRSQVFPRRTDIRIEQVSQWLDQLVKARFLVPFEYKNESYYVSRTFGTHQKIDKPQPSKIPSGVIRGIIDECSTNDQPCIVKESKSNSRVEECNSHAHEKENSDLPNNSNSPPPVPPPPSISNGPPIEEVKMFFSGAGGTDEMAEAFWNKWEGFGWEQNNTRIKNWRAFGNNFIATWYRNEKDKKHGSSTGRQSVSGSIEGINAAFADIQRDLDASMCGRPENQGD